MTRLPPSWPVSLSDRQLDTVTATARLLPLEKRDLFLQRVVAQLKLRGRFTDVDVDVAVRTALQGLMAHEPAGV